MRQMAAARHGEPCGPMQVLGKEKHHLQADSQELMVEWICAIKDCTQDA